MKSEVLSNINAKAVTDIENIGTADSKNLLSFLKNGNAKKKNRTTIRKKIEPPHAERDKAIKKALTNIFKNEIFPLLNFIAETKKYNAIIPNNNPSGSDLNQPAKPLIKIGTETENIRDASKPAVVPPNTRTNANTAIDVRPPTTMGK
tara:strand:+ start:132 stop:575 length:444 start_codon:yes stop_codon:yes gene_type:complete